MARKSALILLVWVLSLASVCIGKAATSEELQAALRDTRVVTKGAKIEYVLVKALGFEDWTALRNGSVLVDENGYAKFSGLKKIKLAELTLDEAKKLVLARYRKASHDRDTTLAMTFADAGDKNPAGSVEVTGGVCLPRKVPVNGAGLTLLEAIKLAGGLTPTAFLTKVWFRRGETSIVLNLKDERSWNYSLEKGDRIRVSQIF